VEKQRKINGKTTKTRAREHTPYFALRQAGHPAAAARRCRDWHIQSVLGQIDIQAPNYAYNHKEAL